MTRNKALVSAQSQPRAPVLPHRVNGSTQHLGWAGMCCSPAPGSSLWAGQPCPYALGGLGMQEACAKRGEGAESQAWKVRMCRSPIITFLPPQQHLGQQAKVILHNHKTAWPSMDGISKEVTLTSRPYVQL